LKQNKPAPENLFASYFIEDPGLPVFMGEYNLTERAEAMNRYRTGNTQEALQIWRSIPADAIGADTLDYYKGIFLLRLGQADSATYYLKPLIKSNSAYAGRAAYYTAMAYWQQQNLEQAQKIFSEMASDTNHPYYDIATEILQKSELK
ncbi:MAG: hypothetical protein LPJ89_02850, partial [Hymenobacteraceae bacterium]|nr:hypothetical protein [Hymenobacteraceae bacterium]